MREDKKQSQLSTFINQLMKGKPEQEIEEADKRFRAYLKLVRRIQERIEREQQ